MSPASTEEASPQAPSPGPALPEPASSAPLPPPPVVIASGASFEGLLTFRGSARVEGRIAGRVLGEGRLEIGEGAEVEAEVEADQVRVAGRVVGDITARDHLELDASAEVEGDLYTPRLRLAEGCRFQGRCHTTPAAPAAEPGASRPAAS